MKPDIQNNTREMVVFGMGLQGPTLSLSAVAEIQQQNLSAKLASYPVRMGVTRIQMLDMMSNGAILLVIDYWGRLKHKA